MVLAGKKESDFQSYCIIIFKMSGSQQISTKITKQKYDSLLEN